MRKLLAILASLVPTAALAQSATPPVGYWASRTSSGTLYVGQNALCKYQGGNIIAVGHCRWNPTTTGGILTIYTQQGGETAPIRENIVWINQSIITVWGEYFYRRG
jgi:hypothetical protein